MDNQLDEIKKILEELRKETAALRAAQEVPRYPVYPTIYWPYAPQPLTPSPLPWSTWITWCGTNA